MKKGLPVFIGITAILLSLLVFFLIFSHGNITGAASGNTASVSLSVEAPGQTMSFVQGWNFISFYLTLNSYDISEILNITSGDYEYILEWNSTSQDFNTWSRQGTKEFSEFNANKSYFLYLNGDRTEPFTGRLYNNITMELLEGWESPDYIYNYEKNITNNISFYNINFTYMQKWNKTEQDFMVFDLNSLSKPFSSVLAGEGYLILSDGGILNYTRE